MYLCPASRVPILVARQYFGTDGCVGIVGEFLTAELVEKLGKAVALWSGGARLRRPRHTRLGPRARGGVRARRRVRRRCRRARGRRADTGGGAARARSRCRDLRVAQPARVQRREVLRSQRAEAHRRGRGGDRGAARRAAPAAARSTASAWPPTATWRTCSSVRLRPLRPADRGRLRERRVLRARAAGVRAARRRGECDRRRAGRRRTSTSAAAQPTSRRCSTPCSSGGFDLGIAFDGDGDRMLAVDENGDAVDGDQIVAILALHLGVDIVAVTSMANLGFHRLMEERGIRVRHDRRRRPLRARGAVPRGRRFSAASSRATSSACATTSPATGSRRAAPLAARSRDVRSRRRVAAMARYPQVKKNMPRSGRGAAAAGAARRVERSTPS